MLLDYNAILNAWKIIDH